MMVELILAEEVKDSEYSRDQIADRMSHFSGDRITVSMLNSWTAESKKLHRFPAQYISAFCHAVGSDGLITKLARSCGRVAIDRQDALLLKRYRNELKINQLKKQNRKLTGLIGYGDSVQVEFEDLADLDRILDKDNKLF